MSIVCWRVTPQNTPAVMRGCNKCGGKRLYRSSDQFRINAQQRNLDVWLIYKCEHCGNTWDMAICSRVKPDSIDPALYQGYMKNDRFLAFKCAFDKSILTQNNVTACYDGVTYEISGPDIDITALSQLVQISIGVDHDPDIRLSKILRQKLGVSQSDFRRLIEQGLISAAGIADLNRAKLKDGMTVLCKGSN